MAGNGPAPKDPSKRARRNKDSVEMRILPAIVGAQPDLPTRYKTRDEEDGSYSDVVDWPTATREWWRVWGESPQAPTFTDLDWEQLKLAALLHAEFVEGNYKIAPELRLREAKFGATIEDRAKLRIQFAMANEAEAAARNAQEGRRTSRNRFGGMTVPQEQIEAS